MPASDQNNMNSPFNSSFSTSDKEMDIISRKIEVKVPENLNWPSKKI